MTMRLTLAAALLATLGMAGCGEYEPSRPRGRSAAPEAVGVVVDPMSQAAPKRGPAPDRAGSGMPKTDTPDGPSPPAQGKMLRKKAKVGAGKKGDYRPGLITTPLSTYWRAQEKLTYEALVPHALDLYRAEHGHFPKTQEEFEEKILKPNNITLPELPEGHRYVYDPQKGELMIEYPRP
jgi:hypothetical protein